jgi:NADPH-dependent 2,4-dienoyl-CoA reductase/sulfur reductase-like enzyme
MRAHKGIDDPKVVLAEDVLTGKSATGMDVVVIGGGMIGSETAAFLSTMCKASVALTTRRADIGGGRFRHGILRSAFGSLVRRMRNRGGGRCLRAAQSA